MDRRVILRYRLLALLTFLTLQLQAQISVKSEEISGKTYRLTFESFTNDHQTVRNNSAQFLIFPRSADSSQAPSRDLYIAVPERSNPIVRFKVIRQNTLEQISMFNTVDPFTGKIPGYEKGALFRSFAKESQYFQVMGFLWIGESYCLHVRVFPYASAPGSSGVTTLQEFEISLDANSANIFSGNQAPEQSEALFINTKYGGRWKGKPLFPAAAQTDGWINYSQDYVKIGVVRDMIYKIAYNDLKNMGVPVTTFNPKTFQMYLKGKQVPIRVFGEQNNIFDSTDYIEFVGRRNYGSINYREPAAFGNSYNEFLNRYSDTTIYWLTWNGADGLRMDTIAAAIASTADTLQYYDHLSRIEDNRFWDFSLYGGDLRKNDPDLLENETWNESTLGVGKTTKLLSVSNLFPTGNVKAFVKTQTSSSNAGDFEPKAHRLALQINTLPTYFDSGDVAKYQVKTLSAALTPANLFNGANSIHYTSFATSYSLNAMYVDWWEFEYPRYIRTTNEEMIFGYRTFPLPKFTTVAVKGITSASYSLYRLTLHDSAVVRIVSNTKRNDTIRFADTVKQGNLYFLASASKIVAPIYYGKKRFVNLRDPANSAGYIAITHPYFKQSVSNYAAFISSTYGLNTKVITVNEIYDEFNYGFTAPEPIREFLKSAVSLWQSPKPKHVVMIGKATYDHFGNKTRYFGAPLIQNFVPSYGNPVSDNWFVTWDSTQALIPQMNIGRLPVGTIAEFDGYFLKHQKYVSKGYDDWNKRYLFFSGGNFITPGQVTQLKAVNDFIIENNVKPAPVGGYRSNFFKTETPETNFGPYSIEHVQNEIEQGGMMISYVGHSATQTWDNSITDINQLSNIRDRNPIITDFGCSTAKHAEPDILSFSELAVSKTKGQAMAYIANSALGFTSTAYTFPQYFYKNLLGDSLFSLGEVHSRAKIQYAQQFGSSGTYGLFLKTNAIIGDPIVTIPKPQKVNLTFFNSSHTILQERVTESIDSVNIVLPFKNLGLWKSDSLRFAVIVSYNGISNSLPIPMRAIPLNDDTVRFSIPVKNKPGDHSITVTLDPLNTVDEIYENDNVYSISVIVASNSIRTLSLSPEVHQTAGKITFINPVQQQPSPNFNVDISLSGDFGALQKYVIPYDTIFTEYQLDGTYAGKRIWMRTKLSDTSSGGLTYSYRVGTKDNYLVNDSLSFRSLEKNDLKMIGQQLMLDTALVKLQVISAGFADGSNATIFKNGENLISDILRRAYHVCIFDSASLTFLKYVRFDIVAGNSTAVDSFKTLIDTSSSKYLFAIALANNGASSNLTAALKASIRSLGSRYIDSMLTNASWAMIGYKGALPGTIKEGFRKQFAGRVELETTYVIPKKSGYFTSSLIGPVAKWKTIDAQYALPGGSDIRMGVIGRSAVTQQYDTLLQNIPADSVLDISSVNASVYPSIRTFGVMSAGPLKISPQLNSLAVNYSLLPELGVNYQTFKGFHLPNGSVGAEILSTDSISQGQKIRFRYRVYNAGETSAKNVPVKLSSIWENNTIEVINLVTVDSIPAKGFKEIEADYNTSLGSGKRTIQLNIDPDTTVREVYRDNNFYTFPVIVKKVSGNPIQPNLSISQNAVSSTPAEITDETDTAGFTIVYSNTGSLVNDSISVEVKHYFQNSVSATFTVRRKYPASNDTLRIRIPIQKRAGQHQLSVEVDNIGLIAESSESDNSSEYFFTVATTDFKVLFPTPNSISSVNQIIFLNPTTAAASSVIAMDLDTLSSHTTTQSYSKQMQQFATTFPLSNLKKNKRYHWRVKVVGSLHDWTVGSFYSGDSSASAFGQIDTVSWKQNIFMRTAFTPDSGARIVDTRSVIKAVSAGFSDGNNGSIVVNGINVVTPILGSGHNVIVLDSSSFSVIAQRRFNITADPDEADSLVQFIGALNTGVYVADVVVDEGANNLTTAARTALKSIGSAFIDQVSFRDSWSIIGRKGAAVGTVPEMYRAQNSGAAQAETTVIRVERSGTVETPLIGPFTSLSSLNIDQIIPPGTTIKIQLVGLSASKTFDTLLTAVDQNIISLASVNTNEYRNGKLVFHLSAPSALRALKRTAAVQSPSVKSWKMSALPSTELAVSSQSSVINRNQVMEGEIIQFSGTVYNVSNVPAESVLVQLKSNASGIDNILKQQRFTQISANDSSAFSFSYDTRGKRGNHSFTFEIDPKDSLSEQSKSNNSVSIPYQVQADTLRPILQVTFDGSQILNGDYVSQQPEIRIKFTDNNPAGLLASDTSNFRIRLNNLPVPFITGTAELLNSTTVGRADVRWTPILSSGENIIQISAKDVSENYSDTILLYVNVATEFMIIDLFNLPNPFSNSTTFTFTLAGPREPDEIIIKIYTVAGRLIQELSSNGIIGFNKIPWDGRDKDGDQIGNGVYLYKVIVKENDKQIEALSKLVKMR